MESTVALVRTCLFSSPLVSAPVFLTVAHERTDETGIAWLGRRTGSGQVFLVSCCKRSCCSHTFELARSCVVSKLVPRRLRVGRPIGFSKCSGDRLFKSSGFRDAVTRSFAQCLLGTMLASCGVTVQTSPVHSMAESVRCNIFPDTVPQIACSEVQTRSF